MLARHKPKLSPPKKTFVYLPCIATSVAVLVCVGIFCTVTYLHKRKIKQQDKKRLEKEENMMKLKEYTERLNVDVEKMCNDGKVDPETTKLWNGYSFVKLMTVNLKLIS